MRLFVSALEPSSNIHLEFLLNEIKKNTQIELFGVFSPHLSINKPLYLPEEFSVMGFVDVFKKISFFTNARRIMAQNAILSKKVLLMDSSSFNIPLAKQIKMLDSTKEIIYYILPQVWAWKPWRAKTIEMYCDKLAAIFPFEIKYYQKKAIYVGHPLLDEIKNIKMDSSYIKSSNIITFMPGSRIGEIKRIFPIFRELKNTLIAMEGNLAFNLVVPKYMRDKDLKNIYGNYDGFSIVFDAQESLLNSKFAFICSGTATLECAIIGTPFVLVYKARAIDVFIAKRLLNIKHIGLANIIYNKITENEDFHIELIQSNLNIDNLIDAYKSTSYILDKSFKIREYLKHGSIKELIHLLFS